MSIKRALVCGAGGFIGSHLVKWLKQQDYRVRSVDLKNPEFSTIAADDFVVAQRTLELKVRRTLLQGPNR